jgi:hypothetical protein
MPESVWFTIDASKSKISYNNNTCGSGECYIKDGGKAILQDDVIHMKNSFNKCIWDFYIESYYKK